MKQQNKRRKTDFRQVIALTLALVSLAGALAQAWCAFSIGERESKLCSYEKGTPCAPCEPQRMTQALRDADGNLLLYDAQTAQIVLYDAVAGQYWDPFNEAASQAGLAAVVRVTVRDAQGNAYRYNSTDNCAGKDGNRFVFDKDMLTVTYTLTADREAEEKTGVPGAGTLRVPVVFHLKNGKLSVTADCEAIQTQEGCYVEELSLLPGLSSVGDATSEGCYYYLPEGCGAKVDLSVKPTEDYERSLPVYGRDCGIGETAQASALLPLFAASCARSVLTTVFTEGDALADIVYERKANTPGGNVYATFSVTPVEETDGKAYANPSYSGKITLSLAFSAPAASNESSEAPDTSVALRAREALSDMGYLPDKASLNPQGYPFSYILVGSLSGAGDETLTTFSQAQEIVMLLHSRGVRSAIVRYAGALNTGLAKTTSAHPGIAEALGGTAGLNALCATADENDARIYLEASVMRGGAAVRTASGKTVSTAAYPELRSAFGEAEIQMPVARANSISDRFSRLAALVDETDGCGIAAAELSSCLYSDRFSGMTRQELLECMREKSSALTLSGGLLLTKPAVYLMRYADFISELPLTTSLSGTDTVEFPLLPMVLHGLISYGTAPLNLSDGGWVNVLRSLEYGAVPSFLFVYESDSAFSYGTEVAALSNYYARMKSLRKLTDMQITSYETLSPGVKKITYNFNTILYINYNKSIVTADGILLSPRDFVLV